jgi:hypothetical protein
MNYQPQPQQDYDKEDMDGKVRLFLRSINYPLAEGLPSGAPDKEVDKAPEEKPADKKDS